MGGFIDLAAVLAPEERAETILGKLGDKARCYSDQADRTLLVYDQATGDLTRVKELSRELGTAAFAFHIHDGALWLYEFYQDGAPTDQFNTLPNYWEELPPEQEATLKGDADLLAQHWPGLNADSIRLYLCNQSEYLEDLDSKAYPDDVFPYGDCWQLTDFLRKLGTPYPPSLDEG